MKLNFRPLALAVLLAGSVACNADSTGPTAPAAPEAQTSLLGGLLGTVTGIVGNLLPIGDYKVLQRTIPLPSNVTVSKTIGYYGGTIAIPQAGLAVTFPRGALSRSTSITVTALAGTGVKYEFGPHGIEFAKPVTVRQDLRWTNAYNNPSVQSKLEGAYYDEAQQSPGLISWLVATVLEILPVRLLSGGNVAEFDVRHFSGYLMAWGKATTF